MEGMQVTHMRTRGFPASLTAPLFLFRDDAPLKAHAAYNAAKSGDPAAAVQLVMDLAEPLAHQVKAAIPSNAIFVAPHAKEAPGDNAIPQVLARALARARAPKPTGTSCNKSACSTLVRPPMERLNTRARFDGAVRTDARYALVGDVTTMGGTLAELANYIQSGGGAVSGSAVLVNAARSGRLTSPARVTALLEKRTWRRNPRDLPDRHRGAHRRGSPLSHRLPHS